MDSFESKSEQATMKFARKVGEDSKPGDIICLRGELGAGKTHFVKGFVTAFGIPPDAVSSPTFSIIQEYSGTLPVYHFDFYRVKDVQEALEIGSEEYFYGEGVSIIEWPERVEAILPDDVKQIRIVSINSTTRNIMIT